MIGLRPESLLSDNNYCSIDPITQSLQYTLIPFLSYSFWLRLAKVLIFKIIKYLILIHSAKYLGYTVFDN